MTRLALVIGAQTGTLRGVGEDVRRGDSPVPLHVHVFELAPHGAITHLTHDATLGLPVAPRGACVLGARAARERAGRDRAQVRASPP